jgi:predicted nuclease of predicted toxin-antitoxin system
VTTPPALFVHLYLDEDVSVLVADIVRAHGFDVLTTREARNLGRSDLEQLTFATTEHRALLTHNRVDFEHHHTEALHQHKLHAGILVASRRSSDFELARRLLTLLDRFTADELHNQLLYL